jgi:plastocyanin
MKRLALFLVFGLAFYGIGLRASSAMADDRRSDNATVSFGQWDPNNPDLVPTIPGEVPLDRFRGDPAMSRGNNHEMFPKVVKINPGDSVSFIISGGHTLAIYDDGTKPRDISLDDIEPPPAPQTAGGILSDSDGRIYRGPDFTGRRDGVEVVQFSKPGTYLVICARKNHFFNPTTQKFEMFGFVEVEKDKHRRW